ncbi:hypothetical protein [Microbacterium candidum]|uniref:Phage tail tape measure protein n=1 Tax=Microbacterium candidum TaxID=3041922 RepID=A0ABT7MWM1_9MICO|nr:hypothetical protein [Microbacterium sp. ASV49]MDL9978850.1 hypothetical protein [Microbacterium sp. ASV49]
MTGLSIDIAMNARAAQAGARDLAKSLDGVADSLDDVAANAGRDGDRVERSFRDMIESARKADRAIDDVGTTGGKSFGRVKDGAKEAQNEIGQNFGETISSFRGDLSDLGQIGQDSLGGLSSSLAGMGPAGAAAGVGLGAIAAGVGVITSAFENAAKATDEAKDSAFQYGLTVEASGKYADAAARINELTGSIEGLKRIQDLETVSGWKQKDVLTALATGDGLPALAKAFNDGANNTMIATNRVLELQGALDGTKQGFALAKDAAKLNERALYDLATSAGKATGEVDDLGNAVITLPGDKKVVIDADTHTAYEDIDALEKRNITVDLRVNTATARNDLERFRGQFSTFTVTPKVGPLKEGYKWQ